MADMMRKFFCPNYKGKEWYFDVKTKPVPVVPPVLEDVPNLSELKIRTTPLAEVNIGGTIAPGWSAYIDMGIVAEKLADVFHKDGTVDGGLLFDIYNSQGYISEFIKPGHDEWLDRQTWVNNIKTVNDFLKYVFGIVNIDYDPSTDSYSLNNSEGTAVIRNDEDFHGILRRSISYKFKVGQGETIVFVKGTTLDYFGGMVIGFKDEEKLKKAIKTGDFALYKLELDGNILPVDLNWYDEDGVERAKYVTMANVNGDMVLIGTEEVPLAPGGKKGALFNAGISAGAVFKRFVVESHFYASLGMIGAKVTTPGYRMKTRCLLVASKFVVPEAILTYDNSNKEWLLESGIYVPVGSILLSGNAAIGPFTKESLKSKNLEFQKTVKIGAFVPVTDWFAVQGHVKLGGKHLTTEDLKGDWDAAIRFHKKPFNASLTALKDPFTKRTMYSVRVGIEFEFPGGPKRKSR